MGAELVGPFPPSSDPATYDRLRRRVLWKLPTGLYLLGSRAGEARNLMTVSLVVQVATDPKLVAVAVEAESHSATLVREGGCFALSLLARAERAVVRHFVKPAQHDPDKGTLSGEAFHDSAVTGAPVLDAAVAFLDCRVAAAHPLGSHELFLGEVVDAGLPENDEDVPVLRMEDTRMSYGG